MHYSFGLCFGLFMFLIGIYFNDRKLPLDSFSVILYYGVTIFVSFYSYSALRLTTKDNTLAHPYLYFQYQLIGPYNKYWPDTNKLCYYNALPYRFYISSEEN